MLWLLVDLPLWKMMDFEKDWDDDIPFPAKKWKVLESHNPAMFHTNQFNDL